VIDHPARPDYLPVEVLDWAGEHHDVLELVVQRLLMSGEWPQVGELTRSLARDGRPSPLSMVLHGMPKPLGFVESQPRRIVLLLFGLRMTDSAHSLLDGFADVLRTAIERFQGDDEHPVLSRSDLLGRQSPHEPSIRALSEILLREAPFLGSGSGGPDEDWSREVTEDVVRYWDVTSAEDYLRIRAHELFAAMLPGWPRADPPAGPLEPEMADSASDRELPPAGEVRDAFISHASEDKDSVARPLAELLVKLGHNVWFDEQELVVGSHLSESIDRGLAQSRFGVVILSRAFFEKPWAKRELEGLVAREVIGGERLILPVWHGIDAGDVAQFSPPLAGVLAARTCEGLDVVAERISKAINKRGDGPAISTQPSHAPSISVEARSAREIIETSVAPPGSPEHWSVYDGMLLLTIVATPVPAGLRHPAGADPRQALIAASSLATQTAAGWPKNASLLTRRLEEEWQPLAPHVWGSGHIHESLERLVSRPSAGASFATRGSVLRVDRTWATRVLDDAGNEAFYAAREPEIAAEMLVSLSLAGALLAELSGLQHVDVAVQIAAAPMGTTLVSSDRAVSGGRFGDPVGAIRATTEVPSHYVDEGRFRLEEIIDPYVATRQLLGPWLATFRGDDLFDRLRDG
jgi:hypothetical protein